MKTISIEDYEYYYTDLIRSGYSEMDASAEMEKDFNNPYKHTS